MIIKFKEAGMTCLMKREITQYNLKNVQYKNVNNLHLIILLEH